MRFRRVVTFPILLIVLAVTLSGCSTWVSTPLLCAPVVLVNGRQEMLSRAEYLNVEPKLHEYLEERGLLLVHDVAAADMLATIDYEADRTDPRRVRLLVLEIEENGMNPHRVNRRRDPDVAPLPSPPIYLERSTVPASVSLPPAT